MGILPAKTKSNAKALVLQDHAGEYLVEALVPGIHRHELEVSLCAHSLTVGHHRKHNRIRLPDDADTLLTAAELKDGRLQIHIPKVPGGCFHPTKTCLVVY